MPNSPLTDAHPQLKTGLERFTNAPFSNWESIAKNFHLRELSPSEHWIKAGDYCLEMCFILNGLIRIYYIDVSGNEVNQHFYQAGEMVAPISSIINDEACQYYIQALEPSQVMLANFKDLHSTEIQNPEWLTCELMSLQSIFVKMARREAQLLLSNAEQRYKWFCKHYPELLERLPQYHIASFLGITAVSLSRIRKNLKK